MAEKVKRGKMGSSRRGLTVCMCGYSCMYAFVRDIKRGEERREQVRQVERK